MAESPSHKVYMKDAKGVEHAIGNAFLMPDGSGIRVILDEIYLGNTDKPWVTLRKIEIDCRKIESPASGPTFRDR